MNLLACAPTAPIAVHPDATFQPPAIDSIAASQPPALQIAHDHLGSSERPAVLVAIDDVIALSLVSSALEAAGYDVVTSRDGVDTLQWLGRQRFDLLVLELHLPRRTGWEVLQGARRLGIDRPRILVTTLQQGPRLETLVRASGADDFVPRPFAPDLLVERLERLRPIDLDSEPLQEVAVA
jgi:CheY-like chemotaxis protein